MINYGPTFQVTLMEEEALTPGPGLLLETRVLDSARLHHWSMRLLMRSDIPTGSWSLNMSCGSVDIWRNFTPFMSWWTTEIWQTISDKTPPCLTGRLQQDGGTVASSSLLLLFPISASTGLHHVHPTWAGTFVLAALVAMFPGINFVLLDSDCLPVTLFEVEDLWTEAYLARFPAHCESGIPQAHPLPALARFSKDPQVVYTQSRVCSTRMGQGALVVTEPHAELNAGLIVIFRSSHPPLFDWNAWSLRLRSSPGSITDDEFKDEASNLAFAFWDRIGEFLKRSRTGSELSSDEKTLWIQSGLAISPLMGTCLQYSLDFCLAWALIGEWTSRVLFPVPKGPWPRHGHAGALNAAHLALCRL